MNVARWLPSRWGALALVGLVFGSAVLLRELRLDTRLECMVIEDPESLARYDAFRDAYGQDEYVLVAVSGKDLFEVDGLDAMVEAVERLGQSDRIRRVSGIPQIFVDLYGGEDPDALREEITSTPFYEGFFISRDRSMAGIVVEVVMSEADGAGEQVVRDVEAAVEPLRAYGFKVDLVGSVFIDEELRRLSLGESQRFSPVALVVSLAILAVLLRSGRAVAVVLLCAAATILLSLETMAALGWPLNVVTVSFPLILWMLTLANAIHLVTRYQSYIGQGASRDEAVRASLREVVLPCFLSSITTAFGFISLTWSDVQPIREFGLIMAVGMVYAFMVNLVLGSYLLVLFRARGARWIPQADGGRFRAIGAWTVRRPMRVIVFFVALVVIGAYSLTQVRSERNALSFLPDETPAVQSFYRVADTLTGMYSMEIIVDTPGSWLDTAYWGAMTALAEQVAAMEHVTRVMTPLDYLCKIRQWEEGPGPEAYRLPESREEAEDLLALLAGDENSGLDRLVRRDGAQVRLSAMLSTADAADIHAIRAKIDAALAQLPAPLAGHVTGSATQMERLQEALVESQRRSFALAFVLVFASILVGLRSVRLLLISVVPNLMPILSTFTVMMLLDIPLDAGTVMVASIALGIAVDDTVHILAGFVRCQKEGQGNREAVLSALGRVGPSITVTSITACIGFLILGTSAFRPLRYFGLASGVAILIAFLADLFFVPAILALVGGPRQARKLED